MASNVLADIRRDLELHLGERVWLKANRGRRKAMVREGIIESTYPYHFLVRMGEAHNCSRISISYADVLTQSVELCIGAPEQKMVANLSK
jgi:uncharacterized protein Veg